MPIITISIWWRKVEHRFHGRNILDAEKRSNFPLIPSKKIWILKCRQCWRAIVRRHSIIRDGNDDCLNEVLFGSVYFRKKQMIDGSVEWWQDTSESAHIPPRRKKVRGRWGEGGREYEGCKGKEGIISKSAPLVFLIKKISVNPILRCQLRLVIFSFRIIVSPLYS